jgi:hypothetical protein
MRGDVPFDTVETEATVRGQVLESGVLEWWKRKHPEYAGDAPTQVMSIVDDWAAATIDMIAHRPTSDGTDTVIVEAKTASSMNEWGQPGTDEIPAHYAAQCLWQLSCFPDIDEVRIAVLGPFLQFYEYVVKRDDDTIDLIVNKARAFYDSLSDDVPPPLDDHPATLATLRRQHPNIDPGGHVRLPVKLVRSYLAAKRRETLAHTVMTGYQSRILARMGDAKYGTTRPHGDVLRRQPGPHDTVRLASIVKGI